MLNLMQSFYISADIYIMRVILMKHKGTEYVLVPAGLLIGIGLGLLYNQVAAGTLIGLGCGFLGSVIVMMVSKKK